MIQVEDGTHVGDTTPTGTRTRVRNGHARHLPLAVALITSLHVALMVAYAFVYPTWTGYDEAQHVDMVYGLQHGAGWPGPGEKIMTQGVTATSDDFDRGRYAQMFLEGRKRDGAAPFAEIDPTPRGQRASFDDMGGAAPVTDGRLSNQMIQHPPLVYAVGAALLTVVPGSADWAYDQQVFLLRLLNIALVAPLPVLAWLAARRFGLAEPLAQVAALLPLAIPGLARVGSSFDNDGIIILSAGALTVLLVGVMRGDLRLRTAAWVGVWLGVALLSKAFALALPIVIACAYLLGWRAARASRHDGVPSGGPTTKVGALDDTGPRRTDCESSGQSKLPRPLDSQPTDLVNGGGHATGRDGHAPARTPTHPTGRTETSLLSASAPAFEPPGSDGVRIRIAATRLRAGITSLPWKPALLAIGLGLALGGWWWARNIVLYGTVSPNGWATDPPRREPLLLPESFFTWFWYFFRIMISRFWGGLGLFEPPQLSPVAIVTATVAVVACCVAAIARRPRLRPEQDQDQQHETATVAVVVCCVAAIARGPRLRPEQDQDQQHEQHERHEQAAPRDVADADAARKTRSIGFPGRLDRFASFAAPVVLLLPIAFTYLMVGQRSYAEYEHYTRGIAVQGRYLYLGLVGLAVVAALGLHRLLGGRDRLAPPIMLAGALAMQALGLLAVCSYYWLPRQVDFTPARIPDIVGGIARWAPFPIGVTITVFVVAVLCVAAVAAQLVQEARRPRESAERDRENWELP